MNTKRRTRADIQNASLVRRPIAAELDTVAQHKEQQMSTEGQNNAGAEAQDIPAPKPFGGMAQVADTAPDTTSLRVNSIIDSSKSVPLSRRRSVDVDVTQQGAHMPPSLPVYGKPNMRPMTIAELEQDWPVLFNEHVLRNNLILDLHNTAARLGATLEIRIVCVKERTNEESPNPRYVLVVDREVTGEEEAAGTSATFVSAYLIDTLPYESITMLPSPVQAKVVSLIAPGEDLTKRFKLFDDQVNASPEASEGTSVSPKRVNTPAGWLQVSELVHLWRDTFNEEELGIAVVNRLRDLGQQQGQIAMRFVRDNDPFTITLQVFKASELPSFSNVNDPFVTKRGEPVEPIDVIHIHTSIVEDVEQAVKIGVQADFVGSRYTPKGSPEEVAGRFSPRGTPPSQLTPSDTRTFDPVAFQQFVDSILRAPISEQDHARLIAFMEFIAKCQQIETTLFFHCTALGRQLDMMLGAGRRHFPGAQMGTPPSVFAPGGRWGDAIKWGSQGQQQTPTPGSFVQPNQLVSDVVISVYNATGTLLGVFQAAVSHNYPA